MTVGVGHSHAGFFLIWSSLKWQQVSQWDQQNLNIFSQSRSKPEGSFLV